MIDVAVIGAGPGGCSAAVQCARLGVKPVLMDRAGRAGGLIRNGFLVENYPGLEAPVSGEQFAGRLQDHVDRFGLEIEQVEVESIVRSGEGWEIRSADRELVASCVIVATGTEPRRLGLEGEGDLAGRRLFYQVKDLIEALPSPGEVAIVGGGEAAFDYSLSLAASGAAVKVFIRSTRPRALGRLAGMVEKNGSVERLVETRVTGLTNSDSAVQLQLEGPEGSRELEVEAVLVAVGREKSTTLQSLTPGPGLFICGDARLDSLGQAGIAVGDGLVAAAEAVATIERMRAK